MLDGQSTALTAMPAARPADRSRDIHVDVDLSGGPAQVPLRVLSTMKGATAERMRDTIEDRGVEALQKKYLNFYADTYDGIRVDAPMEVRDDPHADTLTTIEHYSVDNFWNVDAKPGKLLAKLSVPELEEDFYNPKERIRRMPLSLGEPSSTDVLFVVHGVAMPRIDDTKLAAGATFELERAVHAGGNSLAATWHYEQTAEQVAPSQMKRYLDDLQRAREIDGYGVRAASGSKATVQDWMIGAFVVVLLAMFGRIWWRHQMQVVQAAQAQQLERPELPAQARERVADTRLELQATADVPRARVDRRVPATGVQRLILVGWALIGAVFTGAAAAGGQAFLGLSQNPASPLLWGVVLAVGSMLTWQWSRAALLGRVMPLGMRTGAGWARAGVSWLISAVGFVCFAHATLGGALWAAVVVWRPVDVLYSAWLSGRGATTPSNDALTEGA